MAGALLALLAAWFARAAILETAAQAWVVHDAIEPADAIMCCHRLVVNALLVSRRSRSRM